MWRGLAIRRTADRVLPFALAAAAVAEILLIHGGYDRRIFIPLAVLLPLTLIRAAAVAARRPRRRTSSAGS